MRLYMKSILSTSFQQDFGRCGAKKDISSAPCVVYKKRLSRNCFRCHRRSSECVVVCAAPFPDESRIFPEQDRIRRANKDCSE